MLYELPFGIYGGCHSDDAALTWLLFMMWHLSSCQAALPAEGSQAFGSKRRLAQSPSQTRSPAEHAIHHFHLV